MRYYCTYFDQHYLLRGLALYRSLKAHGGPFALWALCFDQESLDALRRLNLPDLRPISLDDFEAGDEALRAVKPDRSRLEYFFTCSPSLPRYIFAHWPNVDLLTYLDADLFFFSDPEPVFREMGSESILIIGHRFPPRIRHMEASGIYNVGLLSFRRDHNAFECLEWWRARCLEWCFDRVEGGKYADQGYLNDWPSRFAHAHVLQHPGAGLAPWNWANHNIVVRDEHIAVDGGPLVFFHFHGLKFLSSWLYDPAYAGKLYGEMPRRLRRALYRPYLQALKETAAWARPAAPEARFIRTPLHTYRWRVFLSKIRRGKLMIEPGLR